MIEAELLCDTIECVKSVVNGYLKNATDIPRDKRDFEVGRITCKREGKEPSLDCVLGAISLIDDYEPFHDDLAEEITGWSIGVRLCDECSR